MSDGGPQVPISKFRSGDAMPNFRKNYFDIFKLPFVPGQGPGRKPSRGNQESFLDKLCVILPILSYDVVDERKNILRTIAKTGPSDCISFVTSNPVVLVEL